MSEEGLFSPAEGAAVAAVGEGTCVHICGPHGSGRTLLLGIIADRLDDDGYDVLRVHASPAWRNEPYAALVAAGIGPANAPGPRRSAGEMSAGLDQRLSGARTVLTVDDADEMDLPSAGALLAARRRRDVVAVTTSRPRRPGSQDELIPGLSPAIRLRPPLLDIDQVHAVSRQILGGPVSPEALARIAMKSGGLFGLVRAIVSCGRRSGRLREQDGVWTMPDSSWSDELAAAVEPFLAGAGADAWDSATTLAVAGPLPLDEAGKLVGEAALGDLFTLGLAHDAGNAGAAIYPPLLADYLRREGPPLARARAGAGRTAAVTPTGAAAAGADASVRNQQAVYEAAGDVIRLTGDWEAAPTPATAMPLLIAMRAAGVPARQVEQVMAATPADDSFATARLHSWYATWKATDQGELEAAQAILNDITERIPAYTDFFEVTRAHVIFLRDRVPDIGHLAPDPEAELQRVLRAELLLAAGKVEQARGLLHDFRPRGRVATGQVSLLSALGAVLAGDLADGAGQARQGPPGPGGLGDPGLAQAHAYAAGLALGISGRLADGAEVLFGALSMATVASYRDPYHAGVLVLSGVAALVQGRAEYARALAAQAAAADSGGHGPFPGMDHRALTLTVSPDGADELWTLVEDRISRGYITSAVFLAADAVERGPWPGNPGAMPPLGDTALEGRLLPALAGYVAAAAGNDEAALEEVAGALAATGAGLYAVRAEVTRCLLLRRAGRSADAAELAERTWHRFSLGPLDRAGLFARLRQDAGLSEREQEILTLAVARRTTAEIADSLIMSPRTVETHLHNISRKAGVRGRDMLVRAGTSWLREPQP